MGRAAIARCSAGLVLAASGFHVTVFAAVVDEIAGLQAWFKTDSLHATLRNGDAVSKWPDSSGSGRDLTSDGNGSPAIFEVKQIGDHAVVRLGKGNSFSVAKPFELDDHTVFLVYEAARPVGLFDGGVPDQESNGIILRRDAALGVCQLGNAAVPYGRDADLGAGFHITVLGRASGGLHAFLNGKDLSAGRDLGGTLRVGRLFELRPTRYVTLDGLGLRVAEMMFYDRYLTDDERRVVTRYLSEKYAIELAPLIGAVLGTTLSRVVSAAEGYRIRWDEQVELHSPLMHDARDGSSRLVCTRDGTRVRLSVTLTVASGTPESGLRVLVLKNGTEYSDDVATSGPMTGVREGIVELQTTVALDEGDCVEIVAFAADGGGSVTVEPRGSVLRAEILP